MWKVEFHILYSTFYILLKYNNLFYSTQCKEVPSKDFSVREGPAAYQLVGEVTAHQGNDG